MSKSNLTHEEMEKLYSEEMQVATDIYTKIRLKTSSFPKMISKLEMTELCLRMLIEELKARGEEKGIYSEA